MFMLFQFYYGLYKGDCNFDIIPVISGTRGFYTPELLMSKVECTHGGEVGLAGEMETIWNIFQKCF